MSLYRCDSADDLAIFRDSYMPINYESDDQEFYNLLSSVPQINTPPPLLQRNSLSDQNSESPLLQRNSLSDQNSEPPLLQRNFLSDQNSDFPIMEKLATCRKFGGYPHENAEVFLNEFTSYAVLHKIDPYDSPRMIAAFHLNLTGPALTWFNALGAEGKRSWDVFIQIFTKKYIDLDWQSPTMFLESENFQNMKLGKGQILEDFYGQIVEKAKILKKEDHEILSQFIKGLPDKLAFFVRAGAHKDSVSALNAAKMGEAYGYRKEEEIMVAAAKPSSSGIGQESPIVQKLQNQISELTKAVTDLKLQREPRPRPFPKDFNQKGNNVQRPPRVCFNCQAPGHFRGFCNWNGQGKTNVKLQCQLCQQFGHGAFQCLQHTNPGNQRNPGVIGHDPPGDQ